MGIIGWQVKAAVLGVAFILFGGWCYMKGVEQLWEYQAKQAREAVKIVVKQGAVTERIITEFIKVKGKSETIEKIVEKEVLVYANPGYCLDAEWRRLHDASTGTVPQAPGRADGEGGAPTAAEALQTTTQNNTRCIRTADKLDALQSWVRAQSTVQP